MTVVDKDYLTELDVMKMIPAHPNVVALLGYCLKMGKNSIQRYFTYYFLHVCYMLFYCALYLISTEYE